MPKYTEIESPEILEQLIHTRFKDKARIDELAKLEELVNNGYRGMGGSMLFFALKARYPEEYLGFLLKKSPARYEAEVRRQSDEKYAEQRRAKQQELESEEQLADWLAAGGLR